MSDKGTGVKFMWFEMFKPSFKKHPKYCGYDPKTWSKLLFYYDEHNIIGYNIFCY